MMPVWCDWNYIQALSGGQVVLSNLVTIGDGAVNVYADGTNSVVDLSSFTGFSGSAGHYMPVEARNGSRILMPQVVDGHGLLVTVRSGGDVPTAQLRRVLSATADGVSLDLNNVGQVEPGGSLTLLH